jgi:hypothetical protein
MTQIICNHCGNIQKSLISSCGCFKQIKWKNTQSGRISKSPQSLWNKSLKLPRMFSNAQKCLKFKQKSIKQ